MTGGVLQFPRRSARVSPAEADRVAATALASPFDQRVPRAAELHLEDPEVLLAITRKLAMRMESDPTLVGEESEFFFRFLETPARRIGDFDEREYFLGEFALMAGGSNRLLFRREESRAWLNRAEAFFVQCAGASSHAVRVAYQRLALAIEERRFEQIFELAPLWARSADRLGMTEESLKCRLLLALSLQETNRFGDALKEFQEIRGLASAAGNSRLEAISVNNLALLYGSLGQLQEAVDAAQEALPMLTSIDNQVGLAKLRWYMGNVQREQGKLMDSVETYRIAGELANRVGLRGDVAALHLITADVLLELGLDAQAEWEVRSALPIIEEENMVPEGFAALSLLRESLRRRKLDRNALRTLHGYFQE